MKAEEVRIGLRVGALAPKLREQLKKQGLTLTSSECRVFQSALDAINRLSIGLMTGAERDRIVRRLLKRMHKVVRRVR